MRAVLAVSHVKDYKVTVDFYDGTTREIVVKANSRGDASTKVLKTLTSGNPKRITPREVVS